VKRILFTLSSFYFVTFTQTRRNKMFTLYNKRWVISGVTKKDETTLKGIFIILCSAMETFFVNSEQ
jgi:hypothetical protein